MICTFMQVLSGMLINEIWQYMSSGILLNTKSTVGNMSQLSLQYKLFIYCIVLYNDNTMAEAVIYNCLLML